MNALLTRMRPGMPTPETTPQRPRSIHLFCIGTVSTEVLPPVITDHSLWARQSNSVKGGIAELELNFRRQYEWCAENAGVL
jgi:hypothetical protein